MDTASINNHNGLVITRLADLGRVPASTRAESGARARIQDAPEQPLAAAKTVRAPATLSATAPQSINGQDPGHGAQSMLEQLKADWGKSGSRWDLNGDGTVDIRDVLRLLAKIGGGVHDEQTPPADPAPQAEPMDLDVSEMGVGDGQPSPIQQLLADWGKSDSEWDLNGDGTVNIRDFLKLLAEMGAGSDDPPPVPPHNLSEKAGTTTEEINDASEQPGETTPIEQLLADWGKTDSEWDLNGDGTVNIRDFLRLLAKIGGGVHDQQTPPAEQPSPIQQLLADWGKSDSRWDVNGDGTVNIRDFLQLLSKMDKAARAEDGPAEQQVPRFRHLIRQAHAAYNPATVHDLAMIRRGLNFNAVG